MYLAGGETLQQVVCRLPEPLPNDWFKEERLSEILCEALREWSGADCAFLNAGLLLKVYRRGM